MPQLESHFWKTDAGTVGSSGRQFFIVVSLLGLPLGAPWHLQTSTLRGEFNRIVMVWLARGGGYGSYVYDMYPSSGSPFGSPLGAHSFRFCPVAIPWETDCILFIFLPLPPRPSLVSFRKVKNSSVSHFLLSKIWFGVKSVIIAETSLQKWVLREIKCDYSWGVLTFLKIVCLNCRTVDRGPKKWTTVQQFWHTIFKSVRTPQL